MDLHSIHYGQTHLDPAARDRSRPGSLPGTGGDPRADPVARQPVPALRPARPRQEPGGARHRPRRRHRRQLSRLARAATAPGALSRRLHGARRDEATAGAVRPAPGVAAVLADARYGIDARPHRAREPGPADGGLAAAGAGGGRRPRQPCRSSRRGRALERAAALHAVATPPPAGRAAGARRQSRGASAPQRHVRGRARCRAGAAPAGRLAGTGRRARGDPCREGARPARRDVRTNRGRVARRPLALALRPAAAVHARCGAARVGARCRADGTRAGYLARLGLPPAALGAPTGVGAAGGKDAAVSVWTPFFRRLISVFRRLWKDETTGKCRRAALLAAGPRQRRSKTAKTVETATSAGVGYLAFDLFRATAARTSFLNAASSSSSSSWMSMARRTLPSRLELNSFDGSSSAAPLAKVSFTTALYDSPVQMMPSCSHTGTPRHFHVSTTSGSACLMSARTWPSVLPRQSPSSLIRPSISLAGDSALVGALTFFFMLFCKLRDVPLAVAIFAIGPHGAMAAVRFRPCNFFSFPARPLTPSDRSESISSQRASLRSRRRGFISCVRVTAEGSWRPSRTLELRPKTSLGASRF